MRKLTKSYFVEKEINCSHCGMTPPISKGASDTVLYMNHTRHEFGRPLIVNSWYRCPAHEKIIGGSGKNHPFGTALDVNIKNWAIQDIIKLIAIASKYGFIGFGLADNFIHIDRSRWRVGRVGTWVYPSSEK